MDDGTARSARDDEPEGAAGPEDDFRTLAEDWIAIWQSEITAYLADPETQQAWSAMMAVWAGAAQAMMRSMSPGVGPGFGTAPRGAKRRNERRRTTAATAESRPDAATRPAPAAAAPVARDDEIRRLEQRVAELERGLAEQDRRRGTTGENRRTRRAVRPRI